MFPHYSLACSWLRTSRLLIHKDGFFTNKLWQNVFHDHGNCDITLRHSQRSNLWCFFSLPFLHKHSLQKIYIPGIYPGIWTVSNVWRRDYEGREKRWISTCCCSWQVERAGLSPPDWCPSMWPPLKASSFLVCWGFGSGPWTNPGRYKQDIIKHKYSPWIKIRGFWGFFVFFF